MSVHVENIPLGYRVLFIDGRAWIVPQEVYSHVQFLASSVSSLATNCATYAERLKAAEGRA